MAGGPRKSEPVTARFTSLAGQQHTLAFDRGVRLAAMQKQLCTAFSRRFPMTQAALVVKGSVISEFSDRPLLEADDGEEVEGVFSLATDMTFVDRCFRGGRPTFQQDMQETEGDPVATK